MKKQRRVPRPQPYGPIQPFHDAAEAWFWYARAQRARRDGQRFDGPGGLLRPCSADDVVLAAIKLVRRGVLRVWHLRVLASYGFQDRPPDPRLAEEEADARLWDEALDRLTTALRAKGIIAEGTGE